MLKFVISTFFPLCLPCIRIPCILLILSMYVKDILKRFMKKLSDKKLIFDKYSLLNLPLLDLFIHKILVNSAHFVKLTISSQCNTL